MKRLRIYLLVILGGLFIAPYGKSAPLLSSDDSIDSKKAIALLTQFYAAWMNDAYWGKEDSLCKSRMTGYLIEKVLRMSYVMDANALLRCQNYTPDMLASLQVKRLSGRWFCVTFEDRSGEKVEKWEIPLRINAQYLIDFITPPWGDNRDYGDHLFYEKQPVIQVNDQGSAKDFLRTFYQLYTSRFVTLQDGLQEELRTLRKHYCTDECLQQYRAAESDFIKDGTPYFDLLIDNFDFDKRWGASLKIEDEGDNLYRITYVNDLREEVEINLEVVRVDGLCRINYVLE